MNSGNNKEYCFGEGQQKTKKILPNIRAYILTALLLVPSLEIQADNILSQKESQSSKYIKQSSKEKIVPYFTYEAIFKEGIKEALKGINNISQIPVWGKYIDYYRDEWTLKWVKMTKESLDVLNLPESFDINPRIITKPVSSIFFCLWERKFSITPLVGKIKNMYINTEELIIETNIFIDISYDKEIKLGDLMFKLWMTPVGKWEKKWFVWTTVIEL